MPSSPRSRTPSTAVIGAIALLATLPQPALLIALDGTILGSNAMARPAFGLVGDGCKKFNELPDHVRTPLGRAIEAAVRGGGQQSAVVQAATPNPGAASLHIDVGTVRDGRGAVTAVLAMGRRPEADTAAVRAELQRLDQELRATDERLRRQLEELEGARQANERKNEFMAMPPTSCAIRSAWS